MVTQYHLQTGGIVRHALRDVDRTFRVRDELRWIKAGALGSTPDVSETGGVSRDCDEHLGAT